MIHGYFLDQLRRPGVVIPAALVLIAALVLTVKGARRFLRSERPDEPLSNVAMLMGFGWSSEAVWVLAGPTGANLITPIRWSLFVIFEVVMTVFMIRAKRNVKHLDHPGRAGRIAWLVAAGMSLVAVTTAHNLGEAFLRLLVPFLLTAMWWDGLVGEGRARREDATSWRWTPRRLLLAVGAIEPGERDVASVHRERLTQQMVRLYFEVKHGPAKKLERRKARLARLSLAADPEIIACVSEQVDRATWFDLEQPKAPSAAARPSIPASRAVSARAARVLHNRRLRTVRVKHPRPPVPAAQEPEPDPRSKQEIEDAVRFIAAAEGAPSQRQIAHLLRTSPAAVHRALRRKQNPSPPPTVNGRRPELEGVDR